METMKGIIRKIKESWYVEFKVEERTPIGPKSWWERLLLHREDLWVIDHLSYNTGSEQEIEFETVISALDFTTYAKLIKKEKTNTWDDIFNKMESEMDCVIPLKIINYLEKNYMKPTPLETDEEMVGEINWGGLGKDYTETQKNEERINNYKIIREVMSSKAELSDDEIETLAWKNPCLSRKDVYELFDEIFKDKTLEGIYKISASKQILQFKELLRQLAKQKYREQLKQKQ